MQNTCNLANCTLHSAHLISGAAEEWSDFSVLIPAVGWFWRGKWTSAWGLTEVRKTSRRESIVIGLWLQLVPLIISLVKAGRAEVRVCVFLCLYVQYACSNKPLQPSVLTAACLLIDTDQYLSFIPNAKWIFSLRCICHPNREKRDEAVNTWELNLQLARQLLL